MDRDLVRFRRAAVRENRGRRDVRRRYSPTLRQLAVTYCLTRRRQGERLRDVAPALGVAPWSLHRVAAPPGRRPAREQNARAASTATRRPCHLIAAAPDGAFQLSRTVQYCVTP